MQVFNNEHLVDRRLQPVQTMLNLVKPGQNKPIRFYRGPPYVKFGLFEI
jgi:hypothetical protein